MKKKIMLLLFIVYIVFISIITYWLLSFNQYNFFEYADRKYVLLNSEFMEISSNTLFSFNKIDNYQKLKGSNIYYINENNEVKFGFVDDIYNENNIDYFSINRKLYNIERILGSEIEKEYSLLGKFLSFFKSKYVYFGIVLLPLIILFIVKYVCVLRYGITKNNLKNV